MNRRSLAVVVLGAGLSVVLVGCAQTTVIREPVRRPSTGARAPAPAPVAKNGEVVVRKGDTLYRIASAHRVSALDLAVWNRIPPPYTIYPGQRLRLSPADERPAVAETPSTGASTTPATRPAGARPPVSAKPSTNGGAGAPASSGGVAAGSTNASGKPGTTTGTSGTPAGGSTAGGPTTAARPGLVTRPGSKVPAAESVPGRPAATVAATTLTWRWPAEGPVANRFLPDDPTRQGVDITGKSGSPVRAAADGVVVYSGAGLVGYGELVIVKHNDQWLSAYGHNRARLVNEGQLVKAGQQIAEMGRSGASRDLLHFEIRFNGKPVDPLTLLPKR